MTATDVELAAACGELAERFGVLAMLWLSPETPGAAEAFFGEVSQDDLEREYARLFLGVGPATIALSESAWTSPLHLNCQEAQLECRSAYAGAGFEVREAGVPEDHLGLMCGFIATNLSIGKIEEAEVFAAAHPAKWAAALANAVRAREDADFYREIAEETEAALEDLKALAAG